jgi:hypothetical protein
MRINVVKAALFGGGLLMAAAGQAFAGEQTTGAPCGGAYSDTYGSGSSTYTSGCGTNAAKNSVAVVSNEVLKAATAQTVGLISDRINNVTRSVGRQMAAKERSANTTLAQEFYSKRAEEDRLRLAKLQREQFLGGYSFEGGAPQTEEVALNAAAATSDASRAKSASAQSTAQRTSTVDGPAANPVVVASIGTEEWYDSRARGATSRSGSLSDITSLASTGSSKLMPGLGPKGFELNFDEDGGISAGNEPAKWGVWMSGGYSHINYNRSDNAFKGRVWTGAAGLDYRLTQNFFLGISGAWEDVSLDTTFNNGNFDGSGWTVAPYAAYIFNEMFSVDVTGGYSNLSYDMDRLDPGDSTRITGNTDGNRYFGQLNLNADKNIDKWRLGGRIGTLYAWEKKDAFTESNTNRVLDHEARLGRAMIGGRVGYLFANVFEPYADATYRYDYSDGNSPDHDDFLLKGGAKFYMGGMAVGMIEGATPVGRQDTNQWSVVGSIRLNF